MPRALVLFSAARPPADNEVRTLVLPHPRGGEPALFARSGDALVELQRSKSDHGAWFVDDGRVPTIWVIKASKELAGMIRSVPDAARDRPGSTQRVPKRVPVKKGGFFGMPRGVRKRAEAINFDADSPPRSEKSSFCRTAGSRRPVRAIFRQYLSIFGFFAKWKIVPKYYACQQKQGFGPSRCESSRSRDATSENLENRPEN